MLTRRNLLRAALVSPYLARDPFSHSQQSTIMAEPHTLSRESATQFQALIDNCKVTPRDLIILPATRQLTTERARLLRHRADSGAWLILESGLCFAPSAIRAQQAHIWASEFGLHFHPFKPLTALYVEYLWPSRQVVRAFDTYTPLTPDSGEIAAYAGGVPVCCIRRLGRGGIVFLGSMLGPGLAAGEREAHRLGHSIITALANRI